MEHKGVLKNIGGYIFYITLAVVFALTFRTYVFARTTVIGPSMQPTFHDKDSVFLEKVSTETGHISRGEIVTFYSKDENNDDYIKRVIGIAGDKVEIKDGNVYLNGQLLSEDYLPKGTITEPNSLITQYVIPKGYVFVLGDNRGNSTDSRILGPISLKDIRGHVILRVYPFNNIKAF